MLNSKIRLSRLLPLLILASLSAGAETISSSSEPFPLVIDRANCAPVSGAGYKKSVLITRFERLNPASSNPGHLHDIETALPLWLINDLAEQKLSAPASLLLPPLQEPLINSPFELTKVTRQVARQHRGQLVISGTLTDMSMLPGAHYPGLYTRFINGVRDTFRISSATDTRQRLFSLYIQLRDGITGELLFENSYRTSGVWPTKHFRDSGFDSSRFRQSDYGAQVWQLLGHVRDELATAIRCQPHVAPVELREGQSTLVIHSGANHGLRTGDIFNLYQLSQYPITGVYQHYDVRLRRQEVPVQLVEVYPSHSIARVELRAPLTGRFVAISP